VTATPSKGLTVANLAEVRAALRRFVDELEALPDEGIVDAASPIAENARGRVAGVQGRRIAPYLKVEAGKPPRISWGGSTVVVSGGGSVSDLAGGVEFGGPSFFPRGGHRFPAPNLPSGRYLLPAAREGTGTVAADLGRQIVASWNRAARRTR
jgi:hypothetical protein